MSTRKPRPAKKGLKYVDSSHRYWLDGVPVPGVTTILGVLDKPALPRWSAEMVATYVADNPDGIDTLRGIGRDAMIRTLKGIPWDFTKRAATRGTILHAHAETILNGDETDVEPDHVPVIEGALDFLDEWQIDPILTEFSCASREHRWAGTGDLIAYYRRPDTGHEGVGVFDWKSGKKIYPEFAWQLAAYGHAEFHGLDGDETPMPVCDAAFGVHITPDGYEAVPLAYGPDVYEEFVQIRRVHEIAKKGRGDWKRPGSGYAGLPIEKEPS